MYLDIVLIDCLSPSGILTTYRITPRKNRGKVVIDRLSDIDKDFKSLDSQNIGGTRVYNLSESSVQVQQTRLGNFQVFDADQSFSFRFEHMGVPIGPSKFGHGGYYNFVLEPSFRLTEMHIVDPYDKSTNDHAKKKHFKYDVMWDVSCSTSLVNMMLTSGRGSFSFILLGKAKVFDQSIISEYHSAEETHYAVSNLLDIHTLDSKDKRKLANDIAEKSGWLELKPNVMGIGINFNKILDDCIRAFRQKIKHSD